MPTVAQKKSILIIADREQAMLYQGLSLKGEKVDIRSLKDCLDFLKRLPAEIVVLDCGFHIFNGLRMVRRVKGLCPDIPVVFLTDLSSEDAVINAFRSGVREYLRKPVNLFELRTTLQRLLNIKRTSIERRYQFVPRSGRDAAACVRTATTDKPANLLSVVNFVDENPQAVITLECLAKKAHMSKYHFCRTFKRHMGVNPMKFVMTMRIERAKEYLRRCDFTITMAANKAGFNDLSNFVRQFKRLTGMTPSSYKESMRSPQTLPNAFPDAFPSLKVGNLA